MFHRRPELSIQNGTVICSAPQRGGTMRRSHASANVGRTIAVAAATLALVIAISAQAQDYTAQQPTAASPLPTTPGQRQHYVPGHFDAKGMYVPPHYEASKTLHFRGYYASDAQTRLDQKQHGYKEATPNYTMPEPPPVMKPIEGR